MLYEASSASTVRNSSTFRRWRSGATVGSINDDHVVLRIIGIRLAIIVYNARPRQNKKSGQHIVLSSFYFFFFHFKSCRITSHQATEFLGNRAQHGNNNQRTYRRYGTTPRKKTGCWMFVNRFLYFSFLSFPSFLFHEDTYIPLDRNRNAETAPTQIRA